MEAKRFKNGNIHLKLEQGESITDMEFRDVLAKTYEAMNTQCDCDLLGDEYCLGNTLGMCQDLYCYHNGLVLSLPMAEIFELADYHTVVLHARTPDEYDAERINELFKE